MKKALKTTFFCIAIVILACLLISSYGNRLHAGENWFIAILTLLHLFWWIAFLLLLTLGIIFINKKWALLLILVIIICWPSLSKTITFNFSPKKGSSATYVDVFSYNVQMFGLYQYTKSDKKRNAIVSLLQSADADIYCLQDFFSKKHYTEQGKGILNDSYFFHYQTGLVNDKGYGYGLATFSRYPVVQYGKWSLGNSRSAYYALYTDVKIKEDTFRIVNFHLASNRLDPDDIPVILEADKKGVKKTVGWIKKLKVGFKNRAMQVKILKQKLDNSPYSLIVCGDLNAVPVSSAYTTISKNLQDAFLVAGNGFGFTYNGKIPGLRIDYIFCSKNLEIQNFKLYNKSLTDHLPLSIRVGVP